MIGPFAEVLATTSHEPDIVYAELDYAQASAAQGRMRVGSGSTLVLAQQNGVEANAGH